MYKMIIPACTVWLVVQLGETFKSHINFKCKIIDDIHDF